MFNIYIKYIEFYNTKIKILVYFNVHITFSSKNFTNSK